MGIENFISTALVLPNDYVSYHVSRELAQLYPDKAIIEGETYLFDLEAYARGNKCEVVKEASVFNELKADWRGPGKQLRHEAENGWFNVYWQGHFLEVVFVTWTDDGCKSRYHWIVADTAEIAESFFRAVCDWCAEVRGEILVYDDGEWLKSKELFEAIKTASFDNLILPAALKEEIQSDFGRFFSSREAYERYGIPWKRGVLFIGPPGNGKTHTVKALINQLKQPCLYVKSFKSRHGTEQEAMHAVFYRARHTTPCLVVLEDIDSLVDRKNRSFFLNELDGFATNTGVVVLATTNHPERLDPAILDRPSRFDRKYYFELPAPAERRAYIRSWSGKLQHELRISESVVDEIVSQTEGFSFAYMKELFLSSMMQWMSAPEPKSIEAIIADRVARLREQISSVIRAADESSDDDDDDEDDKD
ncbi:MAG TPA: ATP-binding protein [Pyrinomonadaceae bacterium]|nr:ATP-binding protein [Pyrinomonadaceae bacterium]